MIIDIGSRTLLQTRQIIELDLADWWQRIFFWTDFSLPIIYFTLSYLVGKEQSFLHCGKIDDYGRSQMERRLQRRCFPASTTTALTHPLAHQKKDSQPGCVMVKYVCMLTWFIMSAIKFEFILLVTLILGPKLAFLKNINI